MESRQDRRRTAAQTRVTVALACIEEAQCLIEMAAQALCSVNGMRHQWRIVGDLYDKTKGVWHEVSEQSDLMRAEGGPVLDHDPGEYEARWTAALEGDR